LAAALGGDFLPAEQRRRVFDDRPVADLPTALGMGLAEVDENELDLILVLLVDGDDLTGRSGEGASRETAEDQHDRRVISIV
jgi:hypothetical protein